MPTDVAFDPVATASTSSPDSAQAPHPLIGGLWAPRLTLASE